MQNKSLQLKFHVNDFYGLTTHTMAEKTVLLCHKAMFFIEAFSIQSRLYLYDADARPTRIINTCLEQMSTEPLTGGLEKKKKPCHFSWL
ncbi:hypothetical protein PS907_00094 [Pseudomonas fluorescens]|nr:hypothetical protein PS907_00094 [Pseudomonas fluorescens]